jgi:RND family efflux transporter MFP subunit
MNTLVRASFCAALLATLLPGCGGEDSATQQTGPRPVKIFVVAGGDSATERSFPGRVESTYRADLAFRVNGTVQDVLVKEGDLVEQGQVLAKLDPTDYETVVRDRQATFDNNERNFMRARELVDDGFISRTEYDRLEAGYRTSEAALQSAKQDLDYTVLRAPFSGRVAKRHAERFEEIGIKQTMFTLQDVDNLQVKIDVPEALIRSLRPNSDSEPSAGSDGSVRAFVNFEGQGDRRFPLSFREISTRADPQSQTFEVTFNMPAPKDFIVLPGMTATVTVDLPHTRSDQGEQVWVPVDAVVADNELDARVWVLDPQTMTVHSAAVKIGRMEGSRIEVISGLQGGEEIVSVGASYLTEGMPVTRMIPTEQAVPRVGDPT